MTGEARLRSFRTTGFKDRFDSLPAKVQRTARNRYRNYFIEDPYHPLLRRHKLHDTRQGPKNSISVEMAFGYRAVGVYSEDINSYTWYWCGAHHEYDIQFRTGR